MHESVMAFGRRVLAAADVRRKRVIEVGSMDVNGSLRSHVESLKPKRYVGVDFAAGKSVDVVCDACDLRKKFGKESFDVVLSTEMLEHAEDWRGAITAMKRVLRPRGILLLTARGPGFPLHGFPHDWHRFTVDDVRRMFADFQVEALESDPQLPGFLLLARKPATWRRKKAVDLSAIHVAPADEINAPRGGVVVVPPVTAVKAPTISVVMATSGKNRPEGTCPNLLRRAVDSVLAQTFSDFELVLIDDGSTDGTEQVCRQYAARDSRVRFTRFDHNSGFHAIRYNDAMSQSRGEFIAFMFDDDLLYPTALASLLAGFKDKGDDVGMVYGLGHFYDVRTGQPIGLRFGGAWDPAAMRKQNTILNNAVLVRRHVVDHVGGWDEHETMRRICDWDHWLRIGSLYDVVRIEALIGEQFAFHRDSLGMNVPLDLAGARKHQKRRKRVRLQDELGTDKRRRSTRTRADWTPLFDV